MTGAPVSLIKKVDVSNYLSGRRRKNVLPLRSKSQPDATGYSENDPFYTKVKRQGSSAGPDSDGAVVTLIVEKP